MGWGSDAERDFEAAQGQFGGPGGHEPGSGGHFGGGGGGAHGGTGGFNSAEEFEQFMGIGRPAPPPGMVEIPGPPLPGEDIAYAPPPPDDGPGAASGDIYRDHFDANTFAGPRDPVTEGAVRGVEGGFITNTSGYFGFRERLVEDPTAPGGLRSEIAFDPLSALADFAGTVASFATGGLAGLVAGRLVENVAGVALGNKTFDEARRDVVSVPDLTDFFSNLELGAPSSAAPGRETDGAGLPDIMARQSAFLSQLAGAPVTVAGDPDVIEAATGPASAAVASDRETGPSAIYLLQGQAAEGKSIVPLIVTAAAVAAVI